VRAAPGQPAEGGGWRDLGVTKGDEHGHSSSHDVHSQISQKKS